MRDRPSPEPSPEESLLGQPSSEVLDMMRDLGLEKGATIFIKRTAGSKSGKAGQIDGGWIIMGEGEDSEHGEQRVSVGKIERNKPHYRVVNIQELARLNTGRNRGALEYVFKGGDTPERTDLINAVDRADDSAESRAELTEFFKKEALAKAQKMFRGTPVKLRARTFEEMTEEIGEHLHEAEELRITVLRHALVQAENKEKEIKDAVAKGRADEQGVRVAEAKLADARKQKHDFETQWPKDVQELFSLIDLSGQFTR